jgi:hypothetical protein
MISSGANVGLGVGIDVLVGTSVDVGGGAIKSSVGCKGVSVGPAIIAIIAEEFFRKIMINKPKTGSPMISHQFILRIPGGGDSIISGLIGWVRGRLSILSTLGGGM